MTYDGTPDIYQNQYGSFTVTDERHNLATQGQTREHAKEMFNEVSSLLNGNGQHVYDQDLSEYGLHVDDLDTEPIPDNLTQYSFPDSLLDGRTIATVFMQHGLRPVAATDQHLRFVEIHGDLDLSPIIPVHEENLDPFVAGYIAGALGKEHEANDVLGWIDEKS
jgi:hypothetical protein